MGNFKEALGFNNEQDFFDIFCIDANGSWFGTTDPTNAWGLAAYTPQQIWIGDHTFLTDKKLNMYPISLQLSDRAEVNDNFEYFEAKTNPLSIQGIINVVLTNQEADLGGVVPGFTAGTDFIFTARMGQGSADFGQLYGADLGTADVIAYDLTTAAALTVAAVQSGQIAVAGQTYWFIWVTLTAPPTSGDVVNMSLAAPSVTFPDIAAYVISEPSNTFNKTF